MLKTFLDQARRENFGDAARERSVWFNLVFGGLAALFLFALIRLCFSEHPLRDNMIALLIICGGLVASISMLLNWTRVLGLYFRYGHPGKFLAVISKLLGWLGLAMLPAALYSGSATLSTICCVLPFLSWQLWLGRGWAVHPWFGVPVLLLAGFVWNTADRFDLLAAGPGADTSFGVGQYWGAWLVVLIKGAVLLLWAAYFVWEVNEWRRRLRSGAADPLAVARVLRVCGTALELKWRRVCDSVLHGKVLTKRDARIRIGGASKIRVVLRTLHRSAFFS